MQQQEEADPAHQDAQRTLKPASYPELAVSHATLQSSPSSRALSVEITWSSPSMEGTAPCARGGHSAVLADTQLLIFGGHYFGGQGTFVYLNDLHRLDLETSTWYEMIVRDRDAVVPDPRYNHSAMLLNRGERMFVFGGRGDGNQVFRDMYVLDVHTYEWFQVQWTTDGPTGRFGHGVASVDDVQMVLFGGWDGKKSMRDLWVFDSHHFAWTKPKTQGNGPTARQDHSMSAIASSMIMVYGGYTVLPDALPVYNKDVYILDLETMAWSRPRLTGEYPIGTFSQCMCLQNELAYVLGGWSGTVRSPMYMGDKQVKELVRVAAREERLVSGQASKTNRKELTYKLKSSSPYVHLLDVTTMQWYRPRSCGIQVTNRYGHTCTIVGPHLFIFGGWDGNRALNQLVVGELHDQ